MNKKEKYKFIFMKRTKNKFSKHKYSLIKGREFDILDEREDEWFRANNPNIVAYDNDGFGIKSMLCCITGGYGISREEEGTREIVGYDYFMKTAKTGDILLFEGNGMFSWVIQCFSQVRYSHVGIVVRLRDESNGKDYLFVWESTKEDYTYDFLSGGDKDGPRLVSAHEKLYQYSKENYSITYRPMQVQDTRIIQDMEDGITDIYMWALLFLMSGTPYERDLLELGNAHLRLVTGVTEYRENHNRSSMFCSELVSYTYRNGMGFSLLDYRLGRSMAPEDFSPEDFAELTQGIPFTMDFYDEEGSGQLIRPAQAIIGNQFIIATPSREDKTLKNMYERFSGIGLVKRGSVSLKEEIDDMFERYIPEIRKDLLEYKIKVSNRRSENDDAMQDVPMINLKFVYRTRDT